MACVDRGPTEESANVDVKQDLRLMLRSRMPIVVVETTDESRVLDLLRDITIAQPGADYSPLFRWTVTDGLQRVDIDLEPQIHNAEPDDVLKHIRAVSKPGTYVLLDFHPYLSNPLTVRLVKDICIGYRDVERQLIFISHELTMPTELEAFSATFRLALPTREERDRLVRSVANEYADAHPGKAVRYDPKAYDLLLDNLAGLPAPELQRLARNAIFQDGAISKSDLPDVMQAQYELLNRSGVLQFEYDTARFGDVGGLEPLKRWLVQRKDAFLAKPEAAHLDAPKGLLLIGVQGCGKSLAAKAIAGVFSLPLLRLDFGALYNKFHGETEKNLRESLSTADVMSPCVLWIDEIEKGIAGRGGETGTSQRVLATFLTWLAEKTSRVFVVATANEIQDLPPELARKGRFDEIFFVDLPDPRTRQEILRIHLQKRGEDVEGFDVARLAESADGFSGAEIEQAVVGALYSAHAQKQALATEHIAEEIRRTRPLSVVMAERLSALRQWADSRTVRAN